MFTSRKYLLVLLFCITCSVHAIAQTDFYYYNGMKIPLTLNENKVCVSIPKECYQASERIFSNVQPLDTIRSEEFEMRVISRSDYEKLTSMDFWEEDSKSVILTLCYFTERNDEVCASPHIHVRLKKEENIDLLTSCAEPYKLRIIKNWPLMPLWYTLSLTLDSEKSPLECANELWETGFFAASEPDLVPLSDLTDDIQSSSFVKESVSIGYYDLQGRPVSGTQRGIYIRNGKKVLVK